MIGVAKSGFHQNTKYVRALLRGQSKKPLYVSALGISADTALDYVKRMSGEYRIPDLLRKVDQVGREK